jgi:hypothetical protein
VNFPLNITIVLRRAVNNIIRFTCVKTVGARYVKRDALFPNVTSNGDFKGMFLFKARSFSFLYLVRYGVSVTPF